MIIIILIHEQAINLKFSFSFNSKKNKQNLSKYV